MLVLSQQNTSVITQLRRANFKGIIAAQPGIGQQALSALKSDADGVIYPIDFSASTTDASGKKFVDAFTAKYGAKPNTFAAAGYDAASLLIAAIKKAPELSRKAIQEALTAVTKEGLTGAAGTIKFEDRDARVAGLLVQWKSGQETALTT